MKVKREKRREKREERKEKREKRKDKESSVSPCGETRAMYYKKAAKPLNEPLAAI